MRVIEPAALSERVRQDRDPLAVCFVRRGDRPSEELLASLERLAGEFSGRLELGRVDIDADPALMDALRVFKVPELIVYADGRIVERSEGSLDVDQGRQLLEYALAGRAADSTGFLFPR